ncbi:MAG: response regulator [Thermodesulfobacteriota bacterium]|nr:response regulator [Thermodesulfobacteriota bacterium]
MGAPDRTILFVDDDASILSAIKRLLRKEDLQLLTATSGADALHLMRKNDIQVVVSDQRMAEMSGIELLSRVKEEYPDVVRIILTGYTEVDTITEAVNTGQIYRFLLKPWNDENLKLEIEKAFEQYALLLRNKQLAEAVKKRNDELREINDHLEEKVAQRTRELEVRNQALEVSRLIYDNIPLPVVGVGPEGEIVMINRAATTLTFSGEPFLIGNTLEDYFSESEMNVFHSAMDKKEQKFIEKQDDKGITHMVRLTPFPANLDEQGMILTFLIQ